MEPVDRVLERSDALHLAVQRFVREPGDGTQLAELALAIARLQRDASPGYARLLERVGSRLASVEDIVPVPSHSFRLCRVAIHPPHLDRARFATSGTTGTAPGVHALRRLDTYRLISCTHARAALTGLGREPVVAALAPGPVAGSSLNAMMRFFMETFDSGLPLWLLKAGGVDVAALRGARGRAEAERRPLLLLGTSSSLVALLESLEGKVLGFPPDSHVMLTGGFKGKSAACGHHELKHSVSSALSISVDRVIGEYGMTELTSQLYENVGAPAGDDLGSYHEPPWLRVDPVDPLTQRPVPPGDVGIARFLDLGNVDSAVAVLTQDLVRRTEHGVELLGRRPGAPLRGCSLSTEAFLGAAAGGA